MKHITSDATLINLVLSGVTGKNKTVNFKWRMTKRKVKDVRLTQKLRKSRKDGEYFDVKLLFKMPVEK